MDGTGRPVYCTIQHGPFSFFNQIVKIDRVRLFILLLFVIFLTFSVDTADDF